MNACDALNASQVLGEALMPFIDGETVGTLALLVLVTLSFAAIISRKPAPV